MKIRFHYLVLAVIALFLQTGCGVLDYYFLSPPEDTAQELVEAGNEAMREKKYGQAIEYYTKLKDRYPFSPYTLGAELSLADAFFLDGQYMAAEENYKEFESLHPGNEAIPYVLLQIGKSNFEQFRSIDRPQKDLEEALQYFIRVKETYPDTALAEEAEEYITKSRQRLAEHELFVADFYWRSGDYGAAWKRYDFVARNFTDLPDVVQYARERRREAYLQYQLGLTEERRSREQGSVRKWLQEWL